MDESEVSAFVEKLKCTYIGFMACRHSNWMSELVTQSTAIPVWFYRNEISSGFQHNLSFVYIARFKTCFGLYGPVHEEELK